MIQVEIDENEIVYALKESISKAVIASMITSASTPNPSLNSSSSSTSYSGNSPRFSAVFLASLKSYDPDHLKVSFNGRQILNHEILSEVGIVENSRVVVSKFK